MATEYFGNVVCSIRHGKKNQYISQDIHTMVKRGAKTQLPFLEKFSPYFFLETFSSRLYSLSNDALSDERDESRLLMPAGMFFVVVGG